MTNLKSRSRRIIDSLKQELEKARKNARYWEFMAVTDDLTGLHNRRMLSNVESFISERRNPEIKNQVTLLFIDLDDFGQLNKKFGDDVGDDALRLLGKTIRQNIRDNDIAIRKGGDEFVLFLIGTTLEQANNTVVKRLEMLLDGELFLTVKNNTIPIKGSIGVFSYNEKLSPLENLKHADELMRTQKQERKSGNNTQREICIVPELSGLSNDSVWEA